MKQTIHKTKKIILTLFDLGFVETIPSPRLGFLRGVFLANHLGSTDNTDNLTRTTNQPEQPKDSPNKQQHNEKVHQDKDRQSLV